MKISDAELDVMSVLWARPGLAASDVHDALGTEKDWTSRTVKTLLARLVEKGALSTEEDVRRYLYYPSSRKAPTRPGPLASSSTRSFPVAQPPSWRTLLIRAVLRPMTSQNLKSF